MTENVDQPKAAGKKKSRWNRARWILILLLAMGLGGEMFARLYLGLGDPPLMMDDPQIEYLYKPGTHHRFGNLIRYNQYSMRSDDFPASKSNANELRVLVIGDSIINGGAITDQKNLATELLKTHLAADLGKPVIVGNISAGSWGPENQLAYVHRYGKFDADVVVIVWGSEDTFDVPTFAKHAGNDLTAPDRTPPLALWDGFVRYFLPKVGIHWESPEPIPPPATQPADSAIAAIHSLIQTFKPTAKVIVYLHHRSDELQDDDNFGFRALRDLAAQEQVMVVDPREVFAAAANGKVWYRDVRHINEQGQVAMEGLIRDAILRAAPTSQPLAH